MRKLAFFVSLSGIFILLVFINFSSPILINESNLSSFTENQKVIIQGIVQQQNNYQKYSILTLENNIQIHSSNIKLPNLIGENVSVLGIIDTFQKTKISALKIKW